MAKPLRHKNWSQSDVALLVNLRDVERLPWNEIGAELGRSAIVCAARYHREAQRLQRLRDPTLPPVLDPKEVRKLSPEIAQDREARIAALDKRDLTGRFFGDPPPGYSALDKRGARP